MEDFQTIITNTETACALCERDFSHEEIIEKIKNGEAIEKQICLLKLKSVESQADADLLFFHLTNQHGIIREAAAEKINELMRSEKERSFFQSENILSTILDAVIDMNPNICRQIICVLKFIEDKDTFFKKLYQRAIEVIDDASTMNIRNKGYIYSKKVFKIFWYLEAIIALGYFCEKNKSELKNLVLKTYDFKDYTIREKTSKLLAQNSLLLSLNEQEEALKTDENYFVRRFWLNN